MQKPNPLSLIGVGLGTFPFSHVFGRITTDESARILDTFLGNGGSYIQTAPYYTGVEELLGVLLRDVPREQYQLATLCVKDHYGVSGQRQAIRTQCQDSLRRLGVDYLDLYMTSTNASDAPFGETIGVLQELQAEGKVRAIGVCNVNVDQLKEYNAAGAVQYVQNRLSLIDQEPDRDVREYCVEQGISLIPYNVIEWGLLTDKLLGDWGLPVKDLRMQVLPVFGEASQQVLRQWVRASLQPIAAQYRTSIAALAIFWALHQPGVVACPVGATSEAQLLDSLGTSKLDVAVLPALDEAYAQLTQQVHGQTGQQLNDFLGNSYGRW